ncbi:MAG TPA: hypothetical protein V6C58_25580 [Allocoleopsis sp.]
MTTLKGRVPCISCGKPCCRRQCRACFETKGASLGKRTVLRRRYEKITNSKKYEGARLHTSGWDSS